MIWMRRNWPSLVAAAAAIVDVGVLALTVVAAFYVRFKLGWGPDLPPNGFLFFLPINLTFILASMLGGLALGVYTRHRTAGPVDRLVRIMGVVTLGALVAVAGTFFAFPDRLEFVRLLLVYMWAIAALAMFAGRSALIVLLQMLSRRGFGVERVVIIGAGDEGGEVVARMRADPGRRYDVLGFLDDFAESAVPGERPCPVLGRVASLAAVIAEHDVDKVVVAIPSLSHEALLEILERAEASYADVWLLPDLFQLMVSPVTEGGVRGLPLIAVNEVRLRGLSRLSKRALDLVVAGAGLVVLSAPMLLCALTIKATSSGPAFYVQQRVGRDGRRFAIVKFRTMLADAERYGRTWTVDRDPRITAIGRLLRRYSVDELPQLINVLKGDMSLVGPRPERPAYVAQFERAFSRYMVRHRERSGMTGWAQVNGLRGDSSIEDRTRLDVYYVENWSLVLDLRILLRTFVTVIRGHAH